MGFPGGSVGKESACNIGDTGDSVGKIPWRRATHSSVLARRIPWTGEPGGLESVGSKRVGHN